MDNYTKFKHLLEYFVSHLEWVVNKDSSHPGYIEYISPINDFKKGGQGWNNGKIQEQIKEWADYDDGTICISIYSPNFKSNGCYLHWKGTWDNIRPLWDGDHVTYLYLTQEECANAKEEKICSITSLGLFDGKIPNFNLKIFFDNFKYMHMGTSELATECIQLLQANKNLILTGAPGTGKTFLAKAIAKAMGAEYDFIQFHPSYDYTDFVEGLRPTPKDNNGNIGFERKDGVFKTFCKKAIESTGNSSFDSIYQSIVSDIKVGKIQSYQNSKGENYPLRINEKGRIKYRDKSPRTEKEENIKLMYDYLVKNHQFDLSSYSRDDYWSLIKKLSKATQKIDYIEYGWILQELLNRTPHDYSVNKTSDSHSHEQKKYVFIIDEINRGEISKIFGELFFSIDPGYRGKKGLVKTQYQNMINDSTDPFYEGFYVPENVYIIGTMNDIDRSVESMDFAMRRRFAWEEIKAEKNTDMLNTLGKMKDETVKTMKRLNEAIWNEETCTGIEGLNPAYHIGGSYFRNLMLYLDEGQTNIQDAYRHLWENHLKGILFEYLRGTVNASENMKALENVYYNHIVNNDIE